jgi:hypothetical protein
VGGEVTVTEFEPVGLHAVAHQFLFGMPGFVAVSPAALRVDAAAEGVHAGVEVGADTHPVHPGVVADVDDRTQLMVTGGCERARKLAQTQQPLDTKQKAGAADAADQNRDLHIARQYARRRCGLRLAR